MKISAGRIEIPWPFCGHIHLRQFKHFLLESERDSPVAWQNAFAIFTALVKLVARAYDGAVAMPNLLDGWVSTPKQAELYRDTLRSIFADCGRLDFRLLPTFRITHQTTPDMIAEFHELGVYRGKVYPDDPTKEGVTTHSFGGIHEFMDPLLIESYSAMAHFGMPVLSHNEMPGAPHRTAEQEFIPIVGEWLERVPNMKFCFEHISSKAGVEFVCSAGPNVFATITPQHMTQIEVNWCEDHGGSPHNECKPSMKTPKDRDMIVEMAITGHPQFGFGSDSAPHRAEKKMREPGKKIMPGCFNVVAGIPTVLDVFGEHDGAYKNLADFTSRNFCRWNKIPDPAQTVTYVYEPCEVPSDFHGIVNWRAGERVGWQRINP